MNDNYKIIEKYLNGELSDAETADFKIKLKSDNELNEELRVHQAARVAAHVLAYKHLKDTHTFSKSAKKPASHVFYLKKVLTIAASFTVVMGIAAWIWINHEYSRSNIIGEYSYLALSSGVRSADQQIDENYFEAIEAYKIGDYKTTLDKINNIENESSLTRDMVYLRIYALIQSNNLEEAAEVTSSELDINRLSDRYNMDWINVLITLGANDHSSVNGQLEQIIENSDHPYRPDALDLKKKVNSTFFSWSN